jgi:hypothetical protein
MTSFRQLAKKFQGKICNKGMPGYLSQIEAISSLGKHGSQSFMHAFHPGKKVAMHTPIAACSSAATALCLVWITLSDSSPLFMHGWVHDYDLLSLEVPHISRPYGLKLDRDDELEGILAKAKVSGE